MHHTSSFIVGYIEKLFIFHIIDTDYLYIYIYQRCQGIRKGALKDLNTIFLIFLFFKGKIDSPRLFRKIYRDLID